jgi:hypothetical protein
VTALFLIAALLLSQPAAPFKIVVLAGEDSVNVIQQKTAVAPLVEVRDRNNNPVSGAVVTFAVQGGKAAAFQGGAATITVATNAAGQAAAAGFTPLTAGAVNISVEAAIQGQVVTAAITQVNVLTAAEAAAAAGAGGAGSGAGGAAGGGAAGGGGISGTTVGVIGGVAAAGAVVGTQVGGSGDGAAPSARPSASVFRSPFSMNVTLVFGGCSRQETYAGTLTITLESTSPTVTGKAELGPGLGTGTVIASTCPQPVGPIGTGWSMPSGQVTGTESSMVFNSSDVVRTLDNNGDTFARSFIFTGALSGNTITGQIHMVWRHSTPTFPLMDMQTTITLSKQ